MSREPIWQIVELLRLIQSDQRAAYNVLAVELAFIAIFVGAAAVKYLFFS